LIKLGVNTSARNQMVNVTGLIQEKIPSVFDGIVYIYVPHTTAGITINEGVDPSVCKDILSFLGELIPKSAGFTHMEGNSDAHLKSSLVGSSVNLFVENGKLQLGTWQAVFFCEFNGTRSRNFNLKLIEK